MLSAITGRVWAYRRGLATVATITGGVYFSVKYLSHLLREHARKSAQGRAALTDIERRFEQNQQDAALSIQALLSDLGEAVASLTEVDVMTEQLRRAVKKPTAPSTPEESVKEPTPETPIMGKEEKAALWLAIMQESYTRPIASIYLLTLLTLLSHTEINLLGRAFYIASLGVPEDAMEESVRMSLSDGRRLSWEDERIFLTLPSYLIEQGAARCIEWVRDGVSRAMEGTSLTAPCDVRDVRGHVERIRREVEGESPEAFAQRCKEWMIPQSPEDEVVLLTAATGATAPITISPGLRAILDEVYDLIDSPNFASTLEEALGAVFDTLALQIDDDLIPKSARIIALTDSGEDSADIPPPPPSPRLASLLPRISRTSHKVWDGVPNKYTKALSELPTLRAYSAIVYSSYDVVQ